MPGQTLLGHLNFKDRQCYQICPMSEAYINQARQFHNSHASSQKDSPEILQTVCIVCLVIVLWTHKLNRALLTSLY